MTEDDNATKYLNYYCKQLKNPGYAVMINGKWGSGKTWFVKKYLEGLDNKETKSIYVSLYGLATTSDIDYAIFQQLHPILTHKGMRLAGKVLGGIGKIALNFDINGDGKSDGRAELSPSSLSAREFMSIGDNTIIVFDDLERCCIQIDKTLGYINHLIEHCSIKALVVTDETEIEKDPPASDSKYSRTKEKVVGKTLTAPEHMGHAISSFIDEIQTEDVKKILNSNSKIIYEIHEKSSYKNLRSLRHGVLDFERLYNSLPIFSRDNAQFIPHLLRTLLIFSYETRQNYLDPEEIQKLFGSYLMSAILDNNKDSKLQKLRDKYSPFDHDELGLSAKDWDAFFIDGFVEDKCLIESITSNSFFYTKSMESWVKLWHFSDLEDDAFQQTLSNVESNIGNYKYDDLGVILHLTGIFLSLSTDGIIQNTPDGVLAKFKDYLLHIHKSGRINSNTYKFFRRFNDSYKGLGFQARDHPLYKNFYSFAKSISEASMNEQLKRDADNIPNEILTNLDGFIEKLESHGLDNHLIRSNPLFKHANAHDFFCAFMKLKPNDRRRLLYAVVNRYHNDVNNELYKNELAFLLELRNELNTYATTNSGKLSGLLCKWHIDTLSNDIINPRSPANTIG